MKRVFVAGGMTESEKVCAVFRSINAEAASFSSTESLLAEASKSAPDLIIVVHELAARCEAAVQEIRQLPSLKAVPVLMYYQSFTVRPDSRAQTAGADAALLFPVERRDLLARSSKLLRIEKRRQFKTLLTVEAMGRSVMGRSADFSMSGLSFSTDAILDEGENVKIYLFLPGDSERVCLDAIIARRLPMPEGSYFYGVQFVASDSTALRKIEAFVDKGR